MIQKLIENGLPSQVAHSKTLKLKLMSTIHSTYVNTT